MDSVNVVINVSDVTGLLTQQPDRWVKSQLNVAVAP